MRTTGAWESFIFYRGFWFECARRWVAERYCWWLTGPLRLVNGNLIQENEWHYIVSNNCLLYPRFSINRRCKKDLKKRENTIGKGEEMSIWLEISWGNQILKLYYSSNFTSFFVLASEYANLPKYQLAKEGLVFAVGVEISKLLRLWELRTEEDHIMENDKNNEGWTKNRCTNLPRKI